MRFTRHAQNNIRLYKVTEDDIETVIKYAEIRTMVRDKHIAIKKIKGKFNNMPLKVIYTIEDMENIIITTYPIKKTYRRNI